MIIHDGWQDLVARGRTNATAALAVAGMPDDPILQWWDDDGPRLAECMSVTKFVVAMMLGLAVSADDLQAPLRKWIDEWSADARGDITLTQVLTHRTGLVVSPPSEVYQATSVRSFTLASELVNDRRWAYNNRAFHLTGIVAERASGRPLDQLAADRLFAPLGIEEFWWQRDPEGFPLCMAGLHLRARDLARIGSLHLAAGRYGRHQVIPAEWLAAMPTEQGEIGLGCFTQFRDGIRVGFGHDGYLGQWITVQPAPGIVAVRMRTTSDVDDTLGWPTFPGDVNSVFKLSGPEWEHVVADAVGRITTTSLDKVVLARELVAPNADLHTLKPRRSTDDCRHQDHDQPSSPEGESVTWHPAIGIRWSTADRRLL